MRNRRVIIAVVLALGCVFPALAAAQEPSPSTAATGASKAATRTYDLDFTLPTAGKSGCLVCHGDPNLVRASGDTTRTLFVSSQVLQTSAHKELPCTACHLDFAYKVPHQNVKDGSDWRAVAKQSCGSANCHVAELALMVSGAHSAVAKPGEDPALLAATRVAEGKPADVPLCGDCHGSHEIGFVKDKAADAALHRSGLEMCGACHAAQANAYADYYHGAAYRRGALDAPACWDCHEAHELRRADDRESPVNVRNLKKTCGKCHENVNEEYVTYAQMIHRRADIESGIPMFGWWGTAENVFRGALQAVSRWF